MPQSSRSLFRSQLERIWDKLGAKVELRRKRSLRPLGWDHRFDYQKRYIDFGIEPGMRILDIGSGGDPFPPASFLVERHLQPVFRSESLVTNDKPLVVADIHALPFPAKSFDFIYSAHVLEVVEDPIQACKELMRVGKRGYIETPTAGKDALFGWARNLQKWHVVAIASNLCFFEYSDRQLMGVNSTVWRELMFDKWQHPIQDMFWNNQDVFNVMFQWTDRFSVFVFYLNGSIRTLNTSTEFSSPVFDIPLVKN
jgi:Methyltransferase domain